MKIIKTKIIQQDTTIRQVSKTLNINEQTITNWINERNMKNIYKFLKLIKYLNISIEDITPPNPPGGKEE